MLTTNVPTFARGGTTHLCTFPRVAARAIQQFTEDILGRVGLASMLTQARELPRFAGPMPSLGSGRDLRARMTAARPRLQAYFAGPPSAA
jgi:hypothetical protein